jgi:hypothetical protein
MNKMSIVKCLCSKAWAKFYSIKANEGSFDLSLLENIREHFVSSFRLFARAGQWNWDLEVNFYLFYFTQRLSYTGSQKDLSFRAYTYLYFSDKTANYKMSGIWNWFFGNLIEILQICWEPFRIPLIWCFESKPVDKAFIL